MDLSGAGRYNPNLLEELERFAVEEAKQPGSNGYDLEANLALIRQYVTHPENVKIWLLGQILVKAMVQLPKTDFSTSLHLIPEKMQSYIHTLSFHKDTRPDESKELCKTEILWDRLLKEEQPIASLVALMHQLEGAQFSTFWAAADNCREILSPVPGFAESIRSYILKQVNSTCQQIKVSVLGEFLNLDPSSIEKLVAEKEKSEGWKRSSRDKTIIILPKTNLNVLKEPAASTFKFERLAPLLARA